MKISFAACGLLLLSLLGAFDVEAFSVKTAEGTVCANPEPKITPKSKTEADAACAECLLKNTVSKNISDLKTYVSGIKKDATFTRDLAFLRAMRLHKSDREDPLQSAVEELNSHKRMMAIHQTNFFGKDAKLYLEFQNFEEISNSTSLKEKAGLKALAQKMENVLEGKIKNYLKSKDSIHPSEEDEAANDFERVLKRLRIAKDKLNSISQLLGSSNDFDANLIRKEKETVLFELDTIDDETLKGDAEILISLQKKLKKIQLEAAKEPSKETNETDYQEALSAIEKDISDYDRTQWNCGLSPAEVYAIVDYTQSGFSKLNKALRTPPLSEKYRLYRDVLTSGLAKIKKFSGEVKRGVTDMPEKVLAQHKPGKIVTYQAFTSTSKESGFSGSQTFVIKSKTGRYIAPLSASQEEEEVLFPAGARFKILSVELQEPIDKFDDDQSKKEKLNRVKITMEEVN